MNRFTRRFLGFAVVLVILPALAEARGSKPVTMTGNVNTNFRPDTLPSGFVFLDGSTTASSVYVVSLCDLTTLRCVVQPPVSYAGKAYAVVKTDAGKYVPKQ